MDNSETHYIKKGLQLLVSTSLFIFLFCRPSLIVGLLQFLDDNVSSKYSIKLFSYSIPRHHVFLLLNWILVLVINSSRLMRKPSRNENFEVHKVKRINQLSDASDAEALETKTEYKKGRVKSQVRDERHISINTGESNVLLTTKDSKDAAQEEEEEPGLESVEELNQKFEDFIKKARQEIRTEVQSNTCFPSALLGD